MGSKCSHAEQELAELLARIEDAQRRLREGRQGEDGCREQLEKAALQLRQDELALQDSLEAEKAVRDKARELRREVERQAAQNHKLRGCLQYGRTASRNLARLRQDIVNSRELEFRGLEATVQEISSSQKCR